MVSHIGISNSVHVAWYEQDSSQLKNSSENPHKVNDKNFLEDYNVSPNSNSPSALFQFSSWCAKWTDYQQELILHSYYIASSAPKTDPRIFQSFLFQSSLLYRTEIVKSIMWHLLFSLFITITLVLHDSIIWSICAEKSFTTLQLSFSTTAF